MVPHPQPPALTRFVADMEALLATSPTEPEILHHGGQLLAQLIATADWLPDHLATPRADRYQQYLLHLDPAERFSVVSFVWGPGQSTPVHNHTVWGLVGVLRGAEEVQPFTRHPTGALIPAGPPAQMTPGMVDSVSPARGDIHAVRNALADAPSISIHVYGGNIGAIRRSVFQPDGSQKEFISGYSNPDPK